MTSVEMNKYVKVYLKFKIVQKLKLVCIDCVRVLVKLYNNIIYINPTFTTTNIKI